VGNSEKYQITVSELSINGEKAFTKDSRGLEGLKKSIALFLAVMKSMRFPQKMD
jgi:hypothetical protein